jgi:Zn-dependent protease
LEGDAVARRRRAPGTLAEVYLFGIPVRFHYTFVFLLSLLFVTEVGSDGEWARDILFIVALFVSVLLHELGHAAMARGYGLRTAEIVLYPLGGIAKFEKPPSWPVEIWIALGGPAVNVIVAGALWLAANRVRGDAAIFLQQVATANALLASVNLSPAFPLDGGRIVRAVLCLKRDEVEATNLATRLSRGISVMVAVFALFHGYFNVVIVALAVFVAAYQENSAATGRAMTRGVPARAAMITDFRTLAHAATLRDAADLVLTSAQRAFPVVHGERVAGLLDRDSFVRGLAREGPDSYVSAAMDRDFLRIEPATDLALAFRLMGDTGACLLVMEGEKLMGLLTRDHVSDFVLLRRLGVPMRSESEA